MSFKILFKDELKGFYKSKVMLVLWIGLPLMAIFFNLIQIDTEGVPLVFFVGIMATSLSGTLSSVMLSTTIVNEKNNHVYDLFLIRPVKRFHLLLAKFFAVYLCLTLALIITLIVGILVDLIKNGYLVSGILEDTIEAIAMGLAGMGIACSAGILIGLITNSVMVAAILSIYLGNQLATAIALPPLFLKNIDPLLFSGLVGMGITAILLAISYKIFQKMKI